MRGLKDESWILGELGQNAANVWQNKQKSKMEAKCEDDTLL